MTDTATHDEHDPLHRRAGRSISLSEARRIAIHAMEETDRLLAEERAHAEGESDGMTDVDLLATLREHLDVIERCCPGEWETVSGDVRHHDVPGDRQHLNTDASWIVGPRSRSRFEAERARAALLALFDLIRRSGD